MKRWIRISKLVFTEFAQFNLLFTLISIYTLITYGEKSHGEIVLTKMAGYLATFAYFYFFRNNRIYFFFNLGWGIKRLAVASFLMDLIITVISLYIANLLFR
ncbi:hypothetical protein [Ekhidna sp.]